MIRRQLTLFVDENLSNVIESVREKYNPEQFRLIKSHVTLCREGELDSIEIVLKNLENNKHGRITISFDKPCRFHDGNGMWLPASKGNSSFQDLRKAVLKGAVEIPKIHFPHITLMHPGNSFCTDSIFEQIEKVTFPDRITFSTISLIEQKKGAPWIVLKSFNLL